MTKDNHSLLDRSKRSTVEPRAYVEAVAAIARRERQLRKPMTITDRPQSRRSSAAHGARDLGLGGSAERQAATPGHSADDDALPNSQTLRRILRRFDHYARSDDQDG
jgi:hypothetical protein